MKLLLDENMPKKLRQDFTEHEVVTVREKGWNGKKNGELLKLMLADGIDVLLTVDKNIEHQQNFSKYSVTVLVFDTYDNSYDSITLFTEQVKQLLAADPLPTGVMTLRMR